MKNHKTLLSLSAAAICICILLCACNNIDPNVRLDTEESGTQFAAQTETDSGNTYDGETVCIGSGRDYPQTVDGVTIDVAEMAVRSFELHYLLGLDSFTSPNDIPLDTAVQYAFCLLYYDELWKMPNSGDVVRTASAEEISDKLKELFGAVDLDASKSVFYSPILGKCEMFQPKNYGRSVIYRVESAEISDETGEFSIMTTFYTDVDKTAVLGRTVLGLEIKDGKAVIRSMTSE